MKTGKPPTRVSSCNRELKFGKLFQKARELGCGVMATGHYARVTYDKATGRWLLKKAMDQAKDQSYFLYTMTQEQLQHTAFPLGHLTKTEVRQIAAQHGFANAHKHDSQDICFIGKEGCAGFLSSHAKTPCPKDPLSTGKAISLARIRAFGSIPSASGGGCIWQRGSRFMSARSILLPITWSSARRQDLYSTTLTARNINLIALPKLDAPHAASGENSFPASGAVGHCDPNGRRHSANSFRRAPAGHHKRAGGGFVRRRCRGGRRHHWVKERSLQTLQIPLYNGKE